MSLAEPRGRKESGVRGSVLSVGQVAWGWVTQGSGGRAAL